MVCGGVNSAEDTGLNIRVPHQMSTLFSLPKRYRLKY